MTRDLYRGREAIPLRGTESAITVPGMADSWDAVLSAYGRLSLAEVLKPALDYAANGFPVSADQCAHTERNLDLLASMPYTSILRETKAPMPGERFVQKDLAVAWSSLPRKAEALL